MSSLSPRMPRQLRKKRQMWRWLRVSLNSLMPWVKSEPKWRYLMLLHKTKLPQIHKSIPHKLMMRRCLLLSCLMKNRKLSRKMRLCNRRRMSKTPSRTPANLRQRVVVTRLLVSQARRLSHHCESASVLRMQKNRVATKQVTVHITKSRR